MTPDLRAEVSGISALRPPGSIPTRHAGCPDCVPPIGRIDDAVMLAMRPDVTLCGYADLMRVPESAAANLLKAKAAGADIRMVCSTLDALRIAEAEPDREVVFFDIGFATTTPPTALAIRLARKKRLANFSVFCNHVLTPRAVRAILDGDLIAQREMAEIFEPRDSFEWPGLDELPLSALRLRDAYADLDAERRFAINQHRRLAVRGKADGGPRGTDTIQL